MDFSQSVSKLWSQFRRKDDQKNRGEDSCGLWIDFLYLLYHLFDSNFDKVTI